MDKLTTYIYHNFLFLRGCIHQLPQLHLHLSPTAENKLKFQYFFVLSTQIENYDQPTDQASNQHQWWMTHEKKSLQQNAGKEILLNLPFFESRNSTILRVELNLRLSSLLNQNLQLLCIWVYIWIYIWMDGHSNL